MAISYVDRQSLPIALGAIQRDIRISNLQFSQLQAAFLLSYAVMYLGGGRLMDLLGTRRGFTLIVGWWSLACISQGFASSFKGLLWSRFFLGAGEAGAFPGAAKAIAEGFEPRDRSAAMAIVQTSTSVGAVIAPPLIAAILAYSNWRWLCIIIASFGLFWTVSWWFLAAPARVSPNNAPVPHVDWHFMFTSLKLWGLFASKFLYDAAFYFYLFWIPKYLLDTRGFDTAKVGYIAWVPYAFHGLGGLTGGFASRALLNRGFSLGASRKLVLAAGAAIMPVTILVTLSPTTLAVLWLSLAFFGQALTSTIAMTLSTDLFPRRMVGTVSGIAGFGGSLGGAVFGLLAAFILDQTHSYTPIFFLVAGFHWIAFAIILATMRDFLPQSD